MFAILTSKIAAIDGRALVLSGDKGNNNHEQFKAVYINLI